MPAMIGLHPYFPDREQAQLAAHLPPRMAHEE
jgi:hypothetical protein